MRCMTCTSGASAAILIRCPAMWASPTCAPQSARTFCGRFARSWPGTSTSITPQFSLSWQFAKWRTAASYPSARSMDIATATRTEDRDCRRLLPLVNDLQCVGFQNARDLISRMHRPRTCAVQLEVNLPVRKRFSRLAQTFISQRQVEVRVSVGGSEPDGGVIGRHRLGDAARLVKHVAEVEIRQGVAGIGCHSSTVVLLGGDKILPVVIQSAQIDVGGG